VFWDYILGNRWCSVLQCATEVVAGCVAEVVAVCCRCLDIKPAGFLK